MPDADPIKVYDARWEVNEFDDDEVRRLFEATFTYGRQLGVDTVTLARDGRLGAPRVLELGVETAMRAGLRVIVCPDPISTPQSYFLTLHASQEHPATMGLTVTASHNPRQYVGIKFTVPVIQAIGLDCGPHGGLTRFREIYHRRDRLQPVSGGSLRLVNRTREYIDFSLEAAGIAPGGLSGLRVVLDGFHGSAGPELATALQLAGVEVEALRIIPDGQFPTGSPNPTSRGKMDAAVRLASDRGGHAVVGVDGDGDRLVFGDRRGILSAGFVAIPVLRAIAPDYAGGRPPVLYDPKVNPLALTEWGRLDVRPVLFRNGHSQIKDYMRRIEAVAAAEESGHYYHRIRLGDLAACCENSILTTLLILRSLHREASLMDELWSLQEAVHTTGEINYQFPDNGIRDRALSAVIECFTSDGAETSTATPDGIDLQGTTVSRGVAIDENGVSLQPGWYSGYLRVATNEKGVVRSYFSAGDEAQIRRVESAARAILADQYGGTAIE